MKKRFLIMFASSLIPFGAILAQSGSLALSSGSASTGGMAGVALSWVSGGGSRPSALQWTLTYPAASVASITATAGAALSSAGKNLSCFGSSGIYTCVVSGLNSSTILDGVVANVSVTVAASATSVAIGVSNAIGALPTSAALAVTGAGGVVTATPPIIPTVVLNSLSCSSSSLTSQGKATCTIGMSGAVTANTSIAVSSSSTFLTTTPVVISAGASSVSFTVTAGSIPTVQNAIVTATLNGISKTATIGLQPSQANPSITSLGCGASALDSGTLTSCSVTLSRTVTASTMITLSSSNFAIAVPVNVAVPVGAAAIAFTATAATVSSTQTAVVTASIGSTSSATAMISVVPATSAGGRVFYLTGETSELSGTTKGAIVTPATGPAGSLVVAGSGSVNFVPAKVGNGVYFVKGGQQNQNTAFYAFKGTQVGKLFNLASGEISFSMKSRYSLAQREALPQYNYRWVYDVFDESNRLHSFYLGTSGGRLIFWYQTGSTANQYYFVPQGQEDALFGSGVVLDVKLTWNGTSNSLYLNGNLVLKQSYTKTAANWTANSSFSIGGTDVRLYGGGYYSFDDILDEFKVWDASQITPTTLLRPAVTGLVNAASQSADTVCSPGSIAQVTGADFTGGSTYSDTSALSTELGAARVKVNDSYAKLISVSDEQAEFLCPDVSPAMLVNVRVENQQGLSDPITTTIQRAAPGIFAVQLQPAARAVIAARTAGLQQTDGSVKFVLRGTGLRSLADLPGAKVLVSINGELVKPDEIRAGEGPGIDEVVVRNPASALQNAPLAIRINITYGDGQVMESNEFTLNSHLGAGGEVQE